MPDVIAQSGVWNDILGSINRKLNQETVETWFSAIEFKGLDSAHNVIRLGAPNEVVRDWVKRNYTGLLDQSLSELNLQGYSVDWIVESASRPSNSVTASRQTGTGAAAALSPSIAFSKNVVSDSRDNASSVSEPAKPVVIERSLNAKYTYDSFVVGSCNQFAHAASLAVAEAPGRTYNPLYIYGGVGLGKTHLMHACGHAIKRRNPHLNLCYLSSERFMNELISAIRYDKTPAFREKYRSVDVLLIDDVQFMAGKERTQEEFFHTFNSLYDQQRQIVISSDCPPREIPTLEERLHSRFEWGLIADIEPPDLETKVAIINRKAEIMGVAIPDDVALFIATRVKNNVRELEGSLVRLIAIASLRGAKITKALAQDAIRNIAGEHELEVLTIQEIQRVVANTFTLRVEELVSKSNARKFSRPRQIAMYLCKKLTKHSYPEIGRAFGGKHHTTVIHSFEKIESLKATDTALQKLVDELFTRLQK
ncbi:MAG TPA: chromosomal replication initiator protein DnaA [Pyrinomonadaceae bacterium]|nr:chromosomal replication initiator protein DnaA [Pyrinomonadaceae bacterium]